MTEIEELREEIKALRAEVDRLRSDRTVHHYHHQAQPAPFVQPSWPTSPGYGPPTWYSTCTGPLTGVAYSEVRS